MNYFGSREYLDGQMATYHDKILREVVCDQNYGTFHKDKLRNAKTNVDQIKYTNILMREGEESPLPFVLIEDTCCGYLEQEWPDFPKLGSRDARFIRRVYEERFEGRFLNETKVQRLIARGLSNEIGFTLPAYLVIKDIACNNFFVMDLMNPDPSECEFFGRNSYAKFITGLRDKAIEQRRALLESAK